MDIVELGAFGRFDAELFAKIAYFVPHNEFPALRSVCKSFQSWLEIYAENRCKSLEADLLRIQTSKSSNRQKLNYWKVYHQEIYGLATGGCAAAQKYRTAILHQRYLNPTIFSS